MDKKFDKMSVAALSVRVTLAMDEAPTTVIIQRYLDALPGDTAAEPIVRELLEQAAGRLRLLCATFLYKSYPRLTRPPVNLETDELLGGVVAGLLTALRTTRPPTVRRFFALANQHMRWQLNDLARRLDERPAAAELTKTGVAAPPSSTASDLSPDGRRMLEVIEGLPEDEREVFDLVGIQGLTHAEVAMVVGVSEKTVQRRLNRARLLLAERLADLRPATSCELTPPPGDTPPALRKVPMASNPQVLELLEEMLNSGKTPEEVCRDCLELLPEVRQRWQEFQLIDVQIRTLLPGLGTGPHASTTAPPGSVPAVPAAFGRYPAAALPAHVGRYRVERLLGEGGFGRVYLAHDEQFQRPVAIKVPHAHLVAQAGDAEAYLAEARTVASLDHPNIVPVFDVGSTEPFPCFVVSKYIDGSNLATKVQASRPVRWKHVPNWWRPLPRRCTTPTSRGSSIGTSSRATSCSTGAASRSWRTSGWPCGNRTWVRGPRYAGTPAYMSPEQARGEGHRVDGAVGHFQPGRGLLRIAHRPAALSWQNRGTNCWNRSPASRPVRPGRWDDTIPKELERICLKALSKRASGAVHRRPGTWPTTCGTSWPGASERPRSCDHGPAASNQAGAAADPRRQSRRADLAPPISRPVKIVPKGLRSFDAHDADFFLELLPGPRDRDGLPESIRFWKTRIEETGRRTTPSRWG